MSKRFMKYTALVSAVLFLAACSSTSIIGSWKNADNGDKQYGSIMVVGLSANVVAKSSVELQMATVLSAKKVHAKGAGGVFNPEVKYTDEDKKQISEKLKAEGFDGLMTVALISQEEQTSYVPGTTYTYAPYTYGGYYGSYWGYYGYYAPQVSTPGYYTTSQVFTVEALLYDVNTEELVWAARSETTDPGNLDKFSQEYAEVVVYQLQKDKMLKTK